MNKEDLKKYIDICKKKGYNKETKPIFIKLINYASLDFGSSLGRTTCGTCRKFTISYLEKKLKNL